MECRMSDSPVKIIVRPNGPLVVSGDFQLTDVDGNAWDLAGKPAVGLCRCGQSAKRPFCDGAHNGTGFTCSATPPPIPAL
jgi:CDGSH-type Zn-finger protein